MKIGYARVSTNDQDLESQKEILKEAGCEKLFVEKITGTKRERPELKKMYEVLREGDEILVTKIDRLARSIIDLNNLVKELSEMGVSIRFIKDNMEFRAGEKASSIQSLLFNVLGSFAQFERDLIVERTSEGRERAKKGGKHMGRPSRPKQDIEKAMKLYSAREENKRSVNDIVKLTSVPRSTIYAEAKKRGI